VPAPATTGLLEVTDPAPATTAKRFYRLVTPQM